MKLYLITGATGHLGSVLLKRLQERKENIRALVLPGEEHLIPEGVECITGDVRDIESLVPFFDRKGYDCVTLFHCAAIITILSDNNPALWDVNVNGTENILKKALENNVEKVVYVNSVHGIPEKPFPEVITESDTFSPDLVIGQYAKSKAAAATIALDYAKKGLNLTMVHPSGIIGPGDKYNNNFSVRTVKAMYNGQIPFIIKGGYDFVDVRDVVEGMLLAEEKGKPGESYILNGDYISIEKLMEITFALQNKKPRKIMIPEFLVKVVAPINEWVSLHMGKKKPLLTKYSIQTLHANGFFSHAKATNELGYHPRPIADSVKDTALEE